MCICICIPNIHYTGIVNMVTYTQSEKDKDPSVIFCAFVFIWPLSFPHWL